VEEESSQTGQDRESDALARLSEDPGIEPVEDYSDDVFEQMYLESQGEEFEEDEGESEEQHPADEAAAHAAEVDLGEDAPVVTDESPADSRVDQLMGQIHQLTQQVTALQAGGQATPKPQEVSVAQRVQELMPNATPEVADQMAKVVKTIADASYGPQIEALTNNINILSGEVNRGRAEKHSDQFDSKLNTLLDLNGVESSEQREEVKNSVLGRGWRQFGAKFDLPHVPLLFKSVLTNHRKFGFEKTESVIDEKERDMKENPPVKSGVTGATGVKGIRDKLSDPRNRKMDFQGDDFSALVTDFLGKTEKFSGKTRRR
jgi:hypothetical protein